MQECVFCNRDLDKGDRLFETPDFFVSTGIGVASPGHLMLVSKNHYDCYADMPDRLRGEFMELKNFVFRKIKRAFSEPFLIEYGVLGQSVRHAHLHFIPKERKATRHYAAYRIKNIFKEMEIPPDIRAESASWDKAIEFRKEYGGYVCLSDGAARLFNDFAKSMSYRNFFAFKLKIGDIPADWKNITAEQRRIDAVKKDITRSRLKF